MPFIQQLIYPALRNLKVPYPPISRIIAGLVLQTAAMAYASEVLKLIYNARPCYDKPFKYPLSEGGTVPNSVSVALPVSDHVLDRLA